MSFSELSLVSVNTSHPVQFEVKFLFSFFFVVPQVLKSKGFMKVLKVFVKLSEVPQRNVKIKI